MQTENGSFARSGVQLTWILGVQIGIYMNHTTLAPNEILSFSLMLPDTFRERKLELLDALRWAH